MKHRFSFGGAKWINGGAVGQHPFDPIWVQKAGGGPYIACVFGVSLMG